ncbi:MAG: hypothetical protein R3174_15410 [Gammaproteobacteria bacterium]|nr:hypothetical protein [Gammaproteobacteria bacterium]
MAESTPISALAGYVAPGVRGAVQPDGAGVILQERRFVALAQLVSPPADPTLKEICAVAGVAAMPPSGRAERGKHATLMWNGPGQWLAAFHERTDGFDALSAAARDSGTTVTDLGHARTIIRIAGRNALDVLLKGCPLDLESLGPDDCAATLLGHFNVQIHVLDSGCIDVCVFRSFGLALWEWLVDAALEYGVEIREAASE